LSAPLIFLAIDVAAVVCAALLAARVLISSPRLRSARLLALAAFGVLCGVILGHQEYGPWMPPTFRIDVSGWAGFLNLARNVTPGAIMLLCFTLFTDRRRFPRWLLVLFAIQLALEEPARWVVPQTSPHVHLVTQTAPALLQTLFAGAALYWTAADWRADLIEARRRTRALTFVVVGLISIVTGLLTRVLIDPDSSANYAVHVVLNTADLAILVFVLFQLTDGDVAQRLDFGPAAGAKPVRAVAAAGQDSDLGRLTTLLETKEVWRQEGLSLSDLATRVGLPEYRLRRLIHEQLGYRNFNALLHDHRIREACRQLADPTLRRTPILTIALSIGYASVNTFNRGFREIMGEAPSAWREAALAAAAPDGE
jgi:AraC-like DNA-binding protein